MSKLFLLLIPMALFSEDLKTILLYSFSNNALISAKTFTKDAKAKELKSFTHSYYPTVDLGAYYQNSEKASPMQAGTVYSGFAKINLEIYDGGRKSAQIKQKYDELQSTNLDIDAKKRALSLEIVEDFFLIKNLQASLNALMESQKSLNIQLIRINKFYEAKLATKDDVNRLQAVFDTNIYEIESLKFKILSAQSSLELKVGKSIEVLDNSSFKNRENIEYEIADYIQSLELKKSAIKHSANSMNSVYYPQVRVEERYSFYGYSDTDTLHPKGLDTQNRVLLSANLRVFDNATIKEMKQSVELNAKALANEIEYKKATQKMQYKLAIERIRTSKIKIKSALSALKSAESAFETVEKKYNVAIVDNVVYLDALTAKTRAKALYEKSKNDLEIAYGMYYFYSGKNLEEYL